MGGKPVVGALDGVGSAEGGLQAHDAPIQLLGLGVPCNRLLQDGERGLELAVLLVELGKSGGGVEGAAAEVFAWGFGPGEAFAFDERPAVGDDRREIGRASCRERV